MSVEEYPWYGLVEPEAPINQGDIINEFPLPVFVEVPEEGSATADVGIEVYNVVVLSQSCELENEKIKNVLVCPVFDFSKVKERDEHLKSSKGKDQLRQGFLPGYHLLNRCDVEGFERDYRVADFRSSVGVDFGYLRAVANSRGRRIRLLPPYREHLAQAYASFISRVGIPLGIPKEFDS